MQLSLDSPVQYVPRIGPTMARRLSRLGIATAYDLLSYAPFRYNDYSQTVPVHHVRPGQTVTVVGSVQTIANVRTKYGKNIQRATISDTSGSLDIVWFNQPFLLRTIKTGFPIAVSGTVSWFGRSIVLLSPEYEILTDADTGNLKHTGRLVPVYSVTEGVSVKWLRGRIRYVLEMCKHNLPEHLPDLIIQKYCLMGIREALEQIHYPHSMEIAARARRRLAFDELFLLRLQSQVARYTWQHTYTSRPITIDDETYHKCISSFPFQLTKDQHTAMAEILSDLSRTFPMNRLLEGDVGSGKTVLAVTALYACILSGHSAVLMAPTHILAKQHVDTVQKLFPHHTIPVRLVTAHTKKLFLQKNQTPILYIGTHALISSAFPWKSLGLVVIDEQQRFGVKQRAFLRTKDHTGYIPHVLTMTATPIPRTVAHVLYGDLDLSVLTTLPQGRKTVKTWLVTNEKRPDAYAWISKQVKAGGQAFIVCPFVEDSESITSVKSAVHEYERLSKSVFPDIPMALLHGRMKPSEKDSIIDSFANASCKILVSTPVVEVGIDIPGATIMIIEDAERFGLSQLHQLRGRVGRRDAQGYCLLFTEQDSQTITHRLQSFTRIQNGPELSELDLKLRGPGELYGTRQHGLPELALASLTDTKLIAQSAQAVHEVIDKDPALANFPHLREKVNSGTISSIAEG